MLADALGQYLVRKTWKRWFLVTGPAEGDALFAEAVRRAAGRFGGRIVAEKTWSEQLDIRRTAEAEVPVFTQVADHDVLIVADEVGRFGEYLPYRTWEPRPVAGTQGLVPVAWDRSLEQWGALQLQSRFRRQAGRAMTAIDYAAWAAIRSIGEAASRAPLVRFRRHRRLHPRRRLRVRRLQGPVPVLPRLGRTAPPAHPAGHRPRRRLHVAARGLPPPEDGARHPRPRPPGKRVPP